VLQAAREIGAAFVAFSPLARAYLTGKLTDVSAFDARDIRRAMPRFEPESYAKNVKLLQPYAALAEEAGCSPAQLALAWLLHKGRDIIPIPGTTSLAHLEEDMGAAKTELSADLIARVEEIINERTVVGPRYNQQGESEVDTENFTA
jgi:aryl-alcohol dehydrogenase-like predicted oxidoreductase